MAVVTALFALRQVSPWAQVTAVVGYCFLYFISANRPYTLLPSSSKTLNRQTLNLKP